MKNTILYYLFILAPIVPLMIFVNNDLLNDWWLIIFILYIFIYRAITDYWRLASKNIITKKDFWKILIPGSRFKYFRELYLP